MRKKQQVWNKLIIDGKCLHFYPASRPPGWIRKLMHLQGVKIEPASSLEVEQFLEREGQATPGRRCAILTNVSINMHLYDENQK